MQTVEAFFQCLVMPAVKTILSPSGFRLNANPNCSRLADREARSISQICELLLRIGAEQYGKEGSRFLQRFDRRKGDS